MALADGPRSRLAALLRRSKVVFPQLGSIEVLLDDLEALGVTNVDALAQKLLTRVPELPGTSEQFRSLLGEVRTGDVARHFARCGVSVAMEPDGPRGPDLGLSSGQSHVRVEVKRFVQARKVSRDGIERLVRATAPAGDTAIDKVLQTIKDAAGQLPRDIPGLVLLRSFAMDIGAVDVAAALQLFSTEVEANESYHQVGGVAFIPGSTPGYRRNLIQWRHPCSPHEVPAWCWDAVSCIGEQYGRKDRVLYDKALSELSDEDEIPL